MTYKVMEVQGVTYLHIGVVFGRQANNSSLCGPVFELVKLCLHVNLYAISERNGVVEFLESQRQSQACFSLKV